MTIIATTEPSKTASNQSANPYDVQPGQKWRDNNPRSHGAEFVVDEIVPVTVSDATKPGAPTRQVLFAKGVRTHTGKKARIRLDRFHGGEKSGYTLISR